MVTASQQLKALEREVQNGIKDNKHCRELYSKIELLALDNETIQNDAQRLSSSLRLQPLKRKKYILDDICRFIFMNSGLYFLGVFLSLPLIFVRAIESMFQVSSYQSFSVYMRKWFAWIMLTAAGVSVNVIGLDDNFNKQLRHSNSVSILTFAHNSNFDGFLVSFSCPFAHFALAKKELFIIPYFSWLSFAIGGVPVDRQNRQRAVSTLNRSIQGAKNNKVCLVIAPEGTRSTTGLLLPFKKGILHLMYTFVYSYHSHPCIHMCI